MTDPTPPAARPVRRWRRRLLRVAIVLVAVALVARVTVPFAVPWVVNRIASMFDLTCKLHDFQISLLSGEVQVWGVEVAAIPKQGEPTPRPYLDVEFAEFDLDVSALFSLDLHVTRLEADGVDVVLERTAEGKVPLLRHLPKSADATPDVESLVETDARAIDLTLPVRVDALRAQHVRIRYLDAYVDPPVESWLESSVRVSGLGREDESARIEVHTYAKDLLDSVTIEARARSHGRSAEVAFDVDVRGIDPLAAPGWLRQFDLEPLARRISIRTSGTLVVTPHPTDEAAVAAKFDLDPLSVVVDGVEAVRVDDVQVDVPSARTDGIHVALVAVDGVHARATRSAEGVFAALGIALGAAKPAHVGPVVVDAAQEQSLEYISQVTAAVLAIDRILALDWRFDELRVRDGSLVLQDAMTGGDVALVAKEARLRDLVFGEHAGDAPVLVTATATSPGVVGEVRVEGELWPVAEPRHASLGFAADGLTGEGLDPYLGLIGVATDFDRAAARGRADVALKRTSDGIELRLEAADLELVDGERTLAKLDRLAVADLHLAREPALGRIDAIEVAGGRLPIRRDADGALHVLGLRTIAASSAEPAAPPESTAITPAGRKDPQPTAATGPLPRLELGALRWSGVELAWLDEAVTGTVTLDPIAMDGEVLDLGIGGPAEPTTELVAKLRARVRPGAFADELVAEGTITTRPGPIDVRLALDVRGSAITWRPFEPYLQALGIVSGLDDGQLRGTLAAGVRIADGVTAIDANLSDFELTAADTSFASLIGIRVDGVTVSRDGLRVANLTVDRPTLRLARRADERVDVLGLVLGPRAALAAAETAEPATAPEAAAAALDLPVLPRVAIDVLQIRGATLGIRDDGRSTPVTSALVIDATVRGATTVPGDGPATIEAVARGEGFLDEARFTGRIEVLADAIAADGTIVATGLRAGPLAAYLPPGVTVAIQDGSATFAARARVARAADAGLAVDAELGRIELRDADEVLAGVERVTLRAPRIDPASGVFTVEEVRVSGAELTLARTALAAFRVAGVEIDLAAAAGPAAESPVAGPAPSLAAPGRATETMPTVVLGALDLELTRLGYVDLSGATPSRPIQLRGRVAIPERTVLLDADPEALPPWALALDARLDPLADAIHVDVQLAPWRADAEIGARLAVTGIHGPALREIAPELAELLKGSDLDGGTLGAELQATVRTRRRSALDVDLARGFGAELELRDVALRGSTDGDVLLGVDAVRIDARQIHPQAGLHFTSIEVDSPRGRVLRDADGLHVAGLVFADPLAGVLGGEAPPSVEPLVAEPATTPPDVAPAGPRRPPFEGMPEVRVDQLLVQGLDFEVRDVVSDPPVTVPIVGLDVEVARFSTRALDEGRPIKFTAVVQGGDVELPKRYESASLLSGIVDSAAALVAGVNDEVQTERRPILAEAAVHGRVAVYPRLDGRVRTSLEGLELTAFRGIAKQMGVDVGDGVLDAGVELRFDGDRGIHTRAVFTFGNLVVDEEPGGPISTYLKLPAPLQTVVFVMKDSAGEITVPIDVTVQGTGVTTGQILGAAASAAGTVIATAVAESPLRIVGGVGGLFGIGGGPAEPLAADARTIEFAAAAAGVPPAARDAIEAVVERVRDDAELVVELRHSFGQADLERADVLANPDPAQTLDLVTRLRQRRDELVRQRSESAAEARVAFALGEPTAVARAQGELRALGRELGECEDALDRMLEFTRPGADQRRDRRTRETAIGIARQRLESVRLAILDIAGPELADRIEVRRPSFATLDGVELGTVALTPKARKQR